MTFSSRTGTSRFRVPFHDVDAARIVWHGNFYKYFEYARTDLMRKHGLDVEDIIAMGYGMVVTETRCRHVSPARYGDELLVKANFIEANHRLGIGYSVYNETRECAAARGRTDLVAVDHDLAFLPQIPAEILSLIEANE